MQEIEPITYQKTTNIEEHRQFLQKINEIIKNLAPTVDAAEGAVAEAAQALADAVAAIETANAASAAAQAAADRAAQSVAVVAGYNERVTDIERTYIKNASSSPQVIDSDLQIVNGHSLSVADGVDVSGDLNVAGQAEIAGMAIEQSGTKTILSNAGGIVMDGQLILDSMSVGAIEMGALSTGVGADGSTVLNNANGIRLGQSVKVPATVTGSRSDDAVNGNRLQNDLDAYSQMMRLTGNQTAKGLKSGNFSVKEFPVGIPTPAHNGKYRLMYKIKGFTETSVGIKLTVQDVSNTANIYLAIMLVLVSESFNGISGTKLESRTSNYTDISTDICFGYKKGEIDIWYKATQYRPKSITIDRITSYGNILQPDIDIFGEIYVDDYTTYDSYLFTGEIQ